MPSYNFLMEKIRKEQKDEEDRALLHESQRAIIRSDKKASWALAISLGSLAVAILALIAASSH